MLINKYKYIFNVNENVLRLFVLVKNLIFNVPYVN